MAAKNDWRWQDGRLAAKQLFDALEACGINPKRCIFGNWFERNGRRAAIQHAKHGGTILAMGRRVSSELTRLDIPHIYLVHPAARGTIRKKERYVAHVKQTLAKISPNKRNKQCFA
jgi:hypothetical protein